MFAVQVLELEPSDERDKTIFKRRVVHVVTEKMRPTYFFGFVRADSPDEAGLALPRAPTHLQKVFGFIQNGTDADAESLNELNAIRRL